MTRSSRVYRNALRKFVLPVGLHRELTFFVLDRLGNVIFESAAVTDVERVSSRSLHLAVTGTFDRVVTGAATIEVWYGSQILYRAGSLVSEYFPGESATITHEVYLA